jgi:hypothetical protein
VSCLSNLTSRTIVTYSFVCYNFVEFSVDVQHRYFWEVFDVLNATVTFATSKLFSCSSGFLTNVCEACPFTLFVVTVHRFTIFWYSLALFTLNLLLYKFNFKIQHNWLITLLKLILPPIQNYVRSISTTGTKKRCGCADDQG